MKIFSDGFVVIGNRKLNNDNKKTPFDQLQLYYNNIDSLLK